MRVKILHKNIWRKNFKNPLLKKKQLARKAEIQVDASSGSGDSSLFTS